MTTNLICGACLLLLITPIVRGAESAPPLPELIRRVVAVDEANQKKLQALEFHEALRTEQLGDDGHVTKHQDVEMLVRPGAADEVTVLSAKGDDLPTDPDAAAAKAKGRVTKNKLVRLALKDMVQRFTITRVGTDVVRGQMAYVLAFEPKPGQTYKDQTEKVLNQLHGRTWISTADFSVLRTRATLAQPVEVAWFLAQITTLDFDYELRGPAGAMGPASIQTNVVVEAPLITIRQRMNIDMTQFEPRAKVAVN